ncbi:MAG: Asp-tRNA(Asn)/Glu-tRNA(Gln) amidotransferase subunit GatB [Candidatus Babeliales bacterium]
MSSDVKRSLDRYPDYAATIGIEVHVQLKTESKIFCSCPNKFGQTPNTNICPVCVGHPGVLPVLNRKAVDYAIMAGLATNSHIAKKCNFARKHYMYPDLPKNYQITQADDPICCAGYVPIEEADGSEKHVRLVRIHLEEDAGKNTHASTSHSCVDLNRAGTPLIEIVSQPDMCTPEEAQMYLTRLHTIVRYLGISDANMEEGAFRADINISVKKKDATELGTKVELKNINSFRFIDNAIEFEIERQICLLNDGKKIRQESRQWDNKNNISIFMRSKEEAQDYRYFTEPDLPELHIDQAWIESLRALLPELPHVKYKRLQIDYGLSPYEADIITQDKALADFFEQTTARCKSPKQICNWILRDLLGYIKEHKLELTTIKMTPTLLAELVTSIDQGIINSKVAQDIFIEVMETGTSPLAVIKTKGLQQVESLDILEPIVKAIIEKNADAVAKYKAGNIKLFGFFVGQAMKETQGKANPKILNDLVQKYLA